MNTEQILAHLARHNVKSTANRILIAEAISKHNGPVSMKELETKLQTIDKSSIFRTLTLFSNHHYKKYLHASLCVLLISLHVTNAVLLYENVLIVRRNSTQKITF